MEKWPQLISFALLILETVYLFSVIFLSLPGLQLLHLWSPGVPESYLCNQHETSSR